MRPATDDKILTAWNGLDDHRLRPRLSGLRPRRRPGVGPQGGRLRAATSCCATAACGSPIAIRTALLSTATSTTTPLSPGACSISSNPASTRSTCTRHDAWASPCLEHFQDPQAGGFYFTSDDHESLITRSRSLHDGALPVGRRRGGRDVAAPGAAPRRRRAAGVGPTHPRGAQGRGGPHAVGPRLDAHRGRLRCRPGTGARARGPGRRTRQWTGCWA